MGQLGFPFTVALKQLNRRSEIIFVYKVFVSSGKMMRATFIFPRFLAICACAGSAALVIVLNVQNWSNTPAVVTSVHPSLAKVELLQFPI